MTLQEIGERLKVEFPDIFVLCSMTVYWHGNMSNTVECEFTLYTDENGIGRIDGFDTLEEGILILKRKLGMLPSGENVDIDVCSVADATVEP